MLSHNLVYIVDDDEAVRKSTSFMLNRAGYCTKSIATGAAFMEMAKGSQLGCVLLDVQMPHLGGLDVQQLMIDHNIRIPVVIVTGSSDIDVVAQAIGAGAHDVIMKPYEKELLITAVQQAISWSKNDRSEERVMSEARTRLACLTGREHDVLEELMGGYTNSAVAKILNLPARTVEICRANIIEKLKARTIIEVMRIKYVATNQMQVGNERPVAT